MRASIKRNLFAPSLLVLGFMAMVLFQNCSNDVGFNQDQAREIDTGPFTANGGGTTEVAIQINEAPDDRTVDDDNPVIDYEVLLEDDVKVDVVCKLNGVVVDCDKKDRIIIEGEVEGTNTFTIEVTTEDGRTGSETITWVVYRRIVQKTKDFSVDVIGTDVDIIINIDNSGSMKYEQESMASRVANFMAPFKDLNYHIAITTTSPIGSSTIWKSSLNYVDGKFVPLSDGSYCIKSSVHSYQQSQALVSDAVVRDLYLRDDNGNKIAKPGTNPVQYYPEGNGWERGIFTTYRAVERVVAGQQGESCMRNGVPKHVIVISDENETKSYGASNTPMPQVEKSEGSNLVNYMASVFGNDTIFKFHSIIVDPSTQEGADCLSGAGARFGTDYYNLSQMTGGHVGSVCALDYSTQLGVIGESISNSSRSQRLDCVAVANVSGSMGQVQRISPSGPMTVGYEYNGDKVDFDDDLAQGTYRITYYCFE